MQKRHSDRKQYFKEQGFTTEKYVIPFIEDCLKISAQTRVLEIGCGEGGNLKPFHDIGCETVGVDISERKLEKAKAFFKEYDENNIPQFLSQDIYDVDEKALGSFDLIIMRDVIEHIHDQEKFMRHVKKFLKKDGKLFLGFPPWYMPFGGHQQICKSKILSVTPYFHLFPKFIYKSILKLFGESQRAIESLLEIKQTGISIERFNTILKREHYTINKMVPYLINPNYEIKFRLKPRKQLGLISMIPFIRNFYTTCCYYLVSLPYKNN